MWCVKLFNKKMGAGAAAVMAAALLCAAPVYAAEQDAEELVTEAQDAGTEEELDAGSGEEQDTGSGGEDTSDAGNGSIEMSTAYPGITVKAGETVSFPLDFESLDGEGYDIALSAKSLPENWTGYFKGDSSQITKVHVDGAGETQEDSGALADFSLSVPAEVQDGVYEIELLADAGEGNTDVLELEVTVSAEQAGESNFSSEYPEQQGASGTSFSFDTTLVNNRGTEQSYSLSAEVPEGWMAAFTPSGETNAVASLSVEAGGSQGITVAITTPANVEKGDYEIPITAVSSDDTLKTTLTVSITGTYALNLSTPDERLSFDAYENKESSVTLSITNTGNVDLTNLNLTSSAPTGWEVSFSESTIDTLEAGATKEVTAYVTPGENAITGDYVTNISISNDQTSASADFRVSVKTSTTWGIAAAAIVIALICGLGIIFKKFGRR